PTPTRATRASAPASCAPRRPSASASPKRRGAGRTCRSLRRRNPQGRRPLAERGAFPSVLRLFADVPHHRDGRRQPAFEAVLAIRPERLVQADRDEEALLDRAIGDREAQRLLLLRILLVQEGVAQLLHLGIARPAEPRLVAGARGEAVEPGIVRIEGDVGGEEDVPAALRDRFLARATRDHALP